MHNEMLNNANTYSFRFFERFFGKRIQVGYRINSEMQYEHRTAMQIVIK
jgi:hypothetical protein